MKTFKTIFFIAVLLIISAITAVTAQVTVGAGNPPSSFSVLELISGGNKGMRLPQLTTAQRNALQATVDFQSERTGKAMGLQIFNITEQCLEYWNGNRWISMCNDVPPFIGPRITAPASFYCNQTVADLLACVTADADHTVNIYNSASVLITIMTTPLVAGDYFISQTNLKGDESDKAKVSITVAACLNGGSITGGGTQSATTDAAPSQITANAATDGNCGGSYIYQWEQRYSSDDGSTWGAWGNVAGGTGATAQHYTPPVLTTGKYEFRRKTTCGTEEKYTTGVATAAVTVTYSISNNAITCPSGTVTISDGTKIILTGSTATSAGGALSYIWQEKVGAAAWFNAADSNSENYKTPTLSNNAYQYRRIVTVTSNGTEKRDTTAAITINVNNSIATDYTFTANGVSFNLKAVLGGCGYAGRTPSGADNVYISSFSMGETEVTQGLFNAVMSYSGAGTGSQSGINLSPITKPGSAPYDYFGIGDNLPMYYISWYDAILFCNRLSIILGKTPVYSILNSTDPSIWGPAPLDNIDAIWDAVVINYSVAGFRLPTEVEWEYAARGGQQTHNYIYSGSNTLDDVGWHKTISGGKAQPVKSKLPNELFLYDMTGNVHEWCNDRRSCSYPASSCAINPICPTGDYRALRGGAYGTTVLDYFVIWHPLARFDPGVRGFEEGMRVVLPAL
ncbi:hypothetical protein FACS189432_04890 [Bacteroidia bacterium]|nr:hypothetical protein FACS189432_04890 [Bacteroidia bacterium]GHT85087.1 hypothetical protein FACS18947_3410 [Bacteroidia bacterium]